MINDKIKKVLEENYNKQTDLMKKVREEIKKETFKQIKKNIKYLGTPQFNEAIKLAVLKKLAKYMHKSIQDGVKKAQTIKKELK